MLYISCENTIYLSLLFADDCLYLYYVCTDKLGTWPQNKQKCFQTFENCHSGLGNGDIGDIQFTTTTRKPIDPTKPVNTVDPPVAKPSTPQTTTTVQPAPSTTQQPVTTTTKVKLFRVKYGIPSIVILTLHCLIF